MNGPPASFASATVVVVPCFNEEHRVRPEEIARLFLDPTVRVLFVDNGSTDGTLALLQRFAAHEPRAQVMHLPALGGKAEAVRRGMLAALEAGANVTGFLDADLSAPPEEMLRVLRPVVAGEADVALGSRLPLIGARIERTAMRRLLGRAFAASASVVLGVPVYDTQCGAKAFRDTKELRAALAEPFAARWAFDVELLGRLLRLPGGAPGLPVARFCEVPLRQWRDVPGSKLRPRDFPTLGLELWRIRAVLAARKLPR